MKINIIKQHTLPLGINEVPDGIANYLIRVGVAERVGEKIEVHELTEKKVSSHIPKAEKKQKNK